MINSERFLNAFNKIEHILYKLTKQDKGTKFYSLVEAASKHNSLFKHFNDDLKEFADLRNAIIHERTDEHVIAEPNDITVTEIEHLALLFSNPPKVIPLFKRDVIKLSPNDTIAKAVQIMLQKSYSQIPIYKESQFVALLTTNTIARWLGTCVKDDIFSLTDTSISQVLNYTEEKNNYYFLNKDASLVDVLGKFQDYEEKGKILDAILITASGKSSEMPLGIITIWDLPKIYGKLK